MTQLFNAAYYEACYQVWTEEGHIVSRADFMRNHFGAYEMRIFDQRFAHLLSQAKA